MRVFLRIKSEKRKQDIIQVAEKAAKTTVIGKYYKGCSLVKYNYENHAILSIK